MSKGNNTLPAKIPEPTPAELEAKAALAERMANRRAKSLDAPFVLDAGDSDPGSASLAPPVGAELVWNDQVLDTFGTASKAFSDQLMRDLGNACSRPNFVDAINEGMAFVAEIAPRDGLEAVLAVQMKAAHDTSIDFTSRARRAETVEVLNAYAGLAAKSSRLVIDLAGALAKLRTAGKQTVVVEHHHTHRSVYVEAGAQAVIGDVHSGGGAGGRGGDERNRRRPHEPWPVITADPGQAVAEVLGADAGGDAMPRASDAREGQMQASRRQEPRTASGPKKPRLETRAEEPGAGRGQAPGSDAGSLQSGDAG